MLIIIMVNIILIFKWKITHDCVSYLTDSYSRYLYFSNNYSSYLYFSNDYNRYLYFSNDKAKVFLRLRHISYDEVPGVVALMNEFF